jgi:Ca2+/Na+ antiporter
MTSWFDKPSELFRRDKITSFWPANNQTSAERINSSTRFVLYTSCVLYLINRDIRVIVLALLVIVALFLMYKSGQIKDVVEKKETEKCQKPTADNPLGNVLLSDYTDNPTRPEACWYPSVKTGVAEYLDNTVLYGPARTRSPTAEYQRKAFARQFMTGSVSSIPGDQTGFAEWCYGKKFSPQCRNDPKNCDADYWGAQTSAFAGIDPAGNPRTGMFGGR